MEYFTVQHSTKGWFVGFDDFGEKPGWRPRWRWSIPASHEDVEKFFSYDSAVANLDKIQNHEGVRCTIKRFTT